MGVVSLVGFKNTVSFFTRGTKIKGSIFFFAGLLLIILGWYLFTFVGFSLQLYGIFLLFRSFLSPILMYAESLPVIGGFLQKNDTIHRVVKNIERGDGKKRAKFEV